MIIFTVILILSLCLALFTKKEKPASPELKWVDATGGIMSINETGRCVSANENIVFPVQTFARSGQLAQYNLIEDNITYQMTLSEYLIIRYYNKELERALAKKGIIPGQDFNCSINSTAEYNLVVITESGKMQSIGHADYFRAFNCTAPDGEHYECDFDEKYYLWSMWQYIFAEVKATAQDIKEESV